MKRSNEPKAFYVREEPAGGVTRFETFEEAKVFPPPIGGGEGNAGVREPRRPRPGSSPAAIARSSSEM